MRTALESRALGCLLGLAVGDAVGTTLEFSRRDSYPPLTDMVGGGPFQLKPGQWTDDTALAIALGESLCACGGLNLRDLMERFVAWYRTIGRSALGRRSHPVRVARETGLAGRDRAAWVAAAGARLNYS